MSLRGADVTAVVPLKAMGRAKSRLASDLDEHNRRDLAAWMCARVVEAVRGAPSVAGVLVVAGDSHARDVAATLGVPALLVTEPGLLRALEAADDALRGRGATLVVAADLPLATTGDVEQVCRAGAQGRAVVVAPTADGGTGALLRRPPDIMRTAYGAGSAAAHLRLADEAGVAANRLDVPGLALDVDTAEDLAEAGRRSAAVRRWLTGRAAPAGRRPYDRAC